MIFGGVSQRGIRHQNQDAFIVKKIKGGHILTISDGVGQFEDSGFGSRRICDVTATRSHALGANATVSDMPKFLEACHREWTRNSLSLDPDKYCATVLTVCVSGDRAAAARLGDGFLCVYTDAGVFCAEDLKLDKYANQTDALSSKYNPLLPEFLNFKFKKFYGAVACTDGVNIDPNATRAFAEDFIKNYAGASAKEINADISDWLPRMSFSDDATIAYLISKGNVNE